MKIMGVSMQDKTALIIGGVGLILVYSAYKQASDAVGGAFSSVGDALGKTASALAHPIDNIGAAVFGIMPQNLSTTTPTKGFSAYIESMGGIDKYIADHKNGTFNGAPYTPPDSKVIREPWYDPLGIFN